MSNIRSSRGEGPTFLIAADRPGSRRVRDKHVIWRTLIEDFIRNHKARSVLGCGLRRGGQELHPLRTFVSSKSPLKNFIAESFVAGHMDRTIGRNLLDLHSFRGLYDLRSDCPE